MPPRRRYTRAARPTESPYCAMLNTALGNSDLRLDSATPTTTAIAITEYHDGEIITPASAGIAELVPTTPRGIRNASNSAASARTLRKRTAVNSLSGDELAGVRNSIPLAIAPPI